MIYLFIYRFIIGNYFSLVMVIVDFNLGNLDKWLEYTQDWVLVHFSAAKFTPMDNLSLFGIFWEANCESTQTVTFGKAVCDLINLLTELLTFNMHLLWSWTAINCRSEIRVSAFSLKNDQRQKN